MFVTRDEYCAEAGIKQAEESRMSLACWLAQCPVPACDLGECLVIVGCQEGIFAASDDGGCHQAWGGSRSNAYSMMVLSIYAKPWWDLLFEPHFGCLFARGIFRKHQSNFVTSFKDNKSLPLLDGT
jgi:hypothetical protein